MAYKNHLPTCIFKAQIEKHLKRSAVDGSLKNEKIRYLSIQLLNQCQSYREKCYIKIDPKYPDRWKSHWNTEHWTKVKENYSKKLFCKYISFFFFIFLRFKQIERLKGWSCFIIPRTCNKVNHSFQSIAVFLSSPGSHVELLLLQML